MKIKLKDNWELDYIVLRKNGEKVTFKYDPIDDKLVKIVEVKEEELKNLFLNVETPVKDSSSKPSVELGKEEKEVVSNWIKPNSGSSLKNSKKGIGSGNYPHKSKIPQEKIDLIKKIFTNYPNRSIRSVAQELNMDNTTVLRWKNKLFPKEESWHD
jgi:hypothetical protein